MYYELEVHDCSDAGNRTPSLTDGCFPMRASNVSHYTTSDYVPEQLMKDILVNTVCVGRQRMGSQSGDEVRDGAVVGHDSVPSFC